MLVSTFELLVKPITPAAAGPTALARTIVQGYFLTVANTSANRAALRLTFTATTPNLDLANTVVIRDVTGANVFGDLVPTADPKRLTYAISIPANDTALVILQPDVTIPSVLSTANLEVRGYVEIVASGSGIASFDLLLTPEHRGTFFSGSATAPGEIDQLVYSLPTALGKAQYTLTPQKSLIKEVTDAGTIPLPQSKAVKDITDAGVFKPIENPKTIAENLPVPTGNVQEVLLAMAQRLEDLEARLPQGQSFIQPAERPAVGDQILNAVGNGN